MKKKLLLAFASVVFCSPIFTSCDKGIEIGSELNPTEKIDVTSIKAYVSTGITPFNTEKLEVIENPTSISGPKDTIKFYAYLTAPANEDVNITLATSADTTLLNEYNTANDKKLKSAPEGIVNFVNRSVVVKKGELKSEQPLKIAFKDYNLLKNYTDGALAVLRIEKTSNNIKVSENFGQFFVDFTKNKINIKENGDLTKKTAIDSKELKAKANNQYSATYKAENVIDKNIKTIWLGARSTPNLNLEIEMSQQEKLSGIKIITPDNRYEGYSAKKVKLLTSENGTDWEVQGAYTLNGATVNPPASFNLEFYAPVSCKLIKLEILDSYYSAFASIAEIELYK
ncbi:discoidin domain-containing protein [Porphyromonas pogonae]|uniref:discoidin domain-containing protein n=1 Tax=Porphyromonas pogonae TaxID=867595 RepID=UPI002E783967|nr:discoidin domain-containing protein [Porphyromonas pogonae]